MEIKKRIGFSNGETSEFVAFLKENSIPYHEGEYVSTVEIYTSDQHWPQIEAFVLKNRFSLYTSTEFSQTEIETAEWLRVWCKRRLGYPQPENGYIKKGITYDPDKECPNCGSGLEQVGPFRMKKNPIWKKHHFVEMNWIGDELFLSGTAKQKLECSNITGVSFCEVLNSSGKEALQDCFQLVIPHILKPGLVEDQTNLQSITACPVCGQKKYVPSGEGMKVYRRNALKNAPDIAKTYEIFGAMHYAVRSIFIRQKVYKFLKAEHLEDGLVFCPIHLVD